MDSPFKTTHYVHLHNTMAGRKKRPIEAKQHRPSKKQKRQQQYNSDPSSDEDEEQSFAAVNLLDSDDDVHNATADDAAVSGDEDTLSSSDEEQPAPKRPRESRSKSQHDAKAPEAAAVSDDDEEDGEESDVDGSDGDSDSAGRSKRKSKRNDPSAFATSMSKILSTKLSTSKRADPVLSRSAVAHDASVAAVESALETKARRQLREQKRKAAEKGRVKDVLIASRDEITGEAESSTADILETERRLRKVAQRGVVKLFNAVRAAQGVIGAKNRETKVNDMSKKGFLDLIASGGGGLKKGGLEEA